MKLLTRIKHAILAAAVLIGAHSSFADSDYGWVPFDSSSEVYTLTLGEEVRISVSGSASDAYYDVDRISGLPSGLEFENCSYCFEDGPCTLCIDEISGTPTKAGTYRVTFYAAKYLGGPTIKQVTRTVTILPVTKSLEIGILGDEDGVRTLTGDGAYTVGAKVTLKAVANTGYVFAGWYWDEDNPCDDLGVDYRTASVSYKMPNEDTILYAKFVSAEEDAEELTAGMDGEEFEVDGEWEFEIYVDSITVPTVKVTGLPKGLTYNAKTMTISGMPTVPGLYEVTLTLSNSSIKNKTEVFTIRVPNLDSDYIYASWDADDDFYLLAGVSVYDYGEEMYAYAEDGWTLKVSGLPTGLTYNSRTGEITGKPTKIGNYTVTFTATRSGWPTQTATRTIVVEGLLVDLYVMGDEDGMKSLSGDGEYAVGSKVTLKAVANTGYVFAGWYWDEDNPCYALGVDYRTANVSYTMENWDSLELYARFVSMEEDAAELSAHMDGAKFTVDGGWAMDLGREITSVTVPTVKVSGLPKGLTFNSKTLVISGTPTTPGVYEVTLTLSNTSIKNKTEKFTITVPNLDSEYIQGLGDPDEPWTFTIGGSLACIDYGVQAKDGYTLKVSGLPPGLKYVSYSSNRGNISGSPTKIGTYTVTYTATKGKDVQISTRTFVVAALPSRLIGTYTGFIRGSSNGDNCGTFTMTATETGKITAKVVDATGTYSFTGAWDCGGDDNYKTAWLGTSRGKENLYPEVNLNAAWNEVPCRGTFYNAADEAFEFEARKNLLADKWYLKAIAGGTGYWYFTFVDNAKEANLTVTPKGDGTVSIAGKIGTYSVSASSILSLDELANGNGMFRANFVTFATANREKKALSISCDLWFDHSTEHSAGSAMLVD